MDDIAATDNVADVADAMVNACASRSGALFVGLTSKALEITRDEGKRNGGIRQSDWYANATFYIHASLYLR